MTIAAKDMITFGWETFKKRPWILIGGFVLLFIIFGVLSGIVEATLPSEGVRATPITKSLSLFISVVVGALIEMGFLTFVLRAHDDIENVSLRDLWNPDTFLYYVAGQILVGLAVVIGFVLLIVPGIIIGMTLIFTPYLILDRKLPTIEAIKESARMTKGHRMELFLLTCMIIVLNVLGAIALFVGIFVTLPVSMLAIAHAYRKLSALPATA